MSRGFRADDLGPSDHGGHSTDLGWLDHEMGKCLGSLCSRGLLGGGLAGLDRQSSRGPQYPANRLLDGGDPVFVHVAVGREGAAVVDDRHGGFPAHVLDELSGSAQFLAQTARGLCAVPLDVGGAVRRLSGASPVRNPLGEAL